MILSVVVVNEAIIFQKEDFWKPLCLFHMCSDVMMPLSVLVTEWFSVVWCLQSSIQSPSVMNPLRLLRLCRLESGFLDQTEEQSCCTVHWVIWQCNLRTASCSDWYGHNWCSETFRSESWLIMRYWKCPALLKNNKSIMQLITVSFKGHWQCKGAQTPGPSPHIHLYNFSV